MRNRPGMKPYQAILLALFAFGATGAWSVDPYANNLPDVPDSQILIAPPGASPSGSLINAHKYESGQSDTGALPVPFQHRTIMQYSLILREPSTAENVKSANNAPAVNPSQP